MIPSARVAVRQAVGVVAEIKPVRAGGEESSQPFCGNRTGAHKLTIGGRGQFRILSLIGFLLLAGCASTPPGPRAEDLVRRVLFEGSCRLLAEDHDDRSWFDCTEGRWRCSGTAPCTRFHGDGLE